MRNIDFNDIRPIGGSVNEGFEELICQLAHRMIVPARKKFIRNGRPDGGIECYWELDNGDVWMWQAKYFPAVPGASQFEQINSSITTALRLHKNVRKCYIAVPQDLPDDGKAKTKSARKRYEELLSQWHKIEGAEDTEFVYWGRHELLEILSKKDNEGMVYFWFNKNEFTEKDFICQTKKSIADLGSRYTPKLNVELEIAKVFDGFSRNERFEKRYKDHLLSYKKAWDRICPSDKDRKSEYYVILSQMITAILREGDHVITGGCDQLPFDSLISKIRSSLEVSQAYIDNIENEYSKLHELNDTDNKIEYDHILTRDIRNLIFDGNKFLAYLESPECKAANYSIVLVDGEAGVGKSHLFADLVEGRQKDGRYSLFFLGQFFNAHDDPWTQIFKQLKFNGSEAEFLQVLDSKAEATGQRIVLFIDALNEGGGKELWNKYIYSFVSQIKDYPWLGLVMSIRTTYMRAIFGERELEGILRLTHRGFENRYLDAIKLFFRNSNITLPSVPLLLPEFKNPLFLKLFCDGLHKNGLTKVDEGMQGLSSVFSLFIDGVEKELSAPNKKDYLPELRIVNKAVNTLIDYQVEHSSTMVPIDVAIRLTDSVKTDKFSNGELLYELVSYGVLARNLRYKDDNQYEEVVYLSYERFNDYLIAQRLLEKASDFGLAIKRFIKGERDLWYYAGIIESLAIIVPEKTGKEVYDYLTTFRDSDVVVDSVMKSLLWRNKTTIGLRLLAYFNEVMDSRRATFFMSILIQIGPSVNHFFNAEFLHRNLMGWTMADRDRQWSIALKDISCEKDNAIDTLIAWAEEDSRKADIDAESKYLIGLLLGWFTTCMDRHIRDTASKGLINLVRDDTDLVIKLIEKFDGVNDPYVMERIYAAAYGCALLSRKTDRLPDLAKSVYEHIFNTDDEVYPNALVRDYAKGVIEFVLTKYPKMQLGTKPFVPPYKSSFEEDYPTDDEVLAYSQKDEEGKWLTPGIDSILESMVTEHGYSIYGDFGRYVFQSHLDGWQIDPQKLSNLAVKWIMERYGYKEEFFGEYDKVIGYGRMRQVYPGERVGKKYQWIALHEMVARLSDNYPFHDRWIDKMTKYDGTWEPFIRDFDPTMLVKDRIPAWYEPENHYWWNNQEYNEWSEEKTVWVRRNDNLPNPAKVIETIDTSGTHWLTLHALPEWEEPHEKDADMYCALWYQIRSFIIDENKYDDVIRWALNQNFYGKRLPDVPDRYEMFSREYYWSSAYDFYDKDGVTSQIIYDKEEKIADVELPCIGFLWEAEYDYSKPGNVSYYKPSRLLFEGLQMNYSDNDGELVDDDGNILCFDARANHNSHSYFMVRKDALLHYLQSSHKRLLWVLIGEKNLRGPFTPHSEWLEISGTYYLDSHNALKGSMTAYLEGKPIKK